MVGLYHILPRVCNPPQKNPFFCAALTKPSPRGKLLPRSRCDATGEPREAYDAKEATSLSEYVEETG